MADRPVNILVVDDSDLFIQSVSIGLKSKGYDIIIAKSGPDALKIIKENPPDIVLLDLEMPQMDGIQTLENIRTFNKELPVIVNSSSFGNNKKRIDEIKGFGVSGLFPKSGALDELFCFIETAIGSGGIQEHKSY